MKINRLKLINDINNVMPGIATGVVTLENADTLYFKDDHIYTYNSAISVDGKNSQTFELNGMVKGEDFYNCLVKLPNDDIEINQNDKEQWVITDGKIKVLINLLPNNQTIEKRFASLIPSENWLPIDGKDFQNALKVCNMPKNNSKYAGIYCSEKQFISTDSYVINRYESKNEYPNFWISNAGVSELLKWDNFTEVQFNKNWLQFKSENDVVFSVRCLSVDTFPIERIQSLLNSTVNKESNLSSEFTEEFYEAISRASVFSGEQEGHSTVNLHIKNNQVFISSERVSGKYEESVEIETPEGTDLCLIIDTLMIADCSGLFDKFRLIERGESILIIFEKDNAFKMFPSII